MCLVFDLTTQISANGRSAAGRFLTRSPNANAAAKNNCELMSQRLNEIMLLLGTNLDVKAPRNGLVTRSLHLYSAFDEASVTINLLVTAGVSRFTVRSCVDQC